VRGKYGIDAEVVEEQERKKSQNLIFKKYLQKKNHEESFKCEAMVPVPSQSPILSQPLSL
jgi:hypothetical protein